MTYFSLSTNEGQMSGSSFAAQSSGVNNSHVAASAIKAALRACTKGSLRERENAADNTFARVLGFLLIRT